MPYFFAITLGGSAVVAGISMAKKRRSPTLADAL
jgi:hypothetical protein